MPPRAAGKRVVGLTWVRVNFGRRLGSANVHVDKVILNRDEVSSQGINPKEMQANAFAAEILMPEAELMRHRSIDLNDEYLLLARKLKVSITALASRLSNLRGAYSAAGK